MQHFCSSDSVFRCSINQRTNHTIRQSGKRSTFHRTTGQSIFQNTQIYAFFTRIRTQLGHAGNTDTAILCNHEGLCIGNCRTNLLNSRFLGFNIKTQGLPPTVYQKNTETVLHQLGNLKRHFTSKLVIRFRTTVCVGLLQLNHMIPTVLDIYLIFNLSSPNPSSLS
ncbi:Uncharacterised protein [Kingella potus]|uniref:Uncharacterized protein n=1 Tax=Kingella potus TaxID=265175 RepID=A0A377R2A3_9NEIS|nr:Uncharacterised protein [Kingella potus]